MTSSKASTTPNLSSSQAQPQLYTQSTMSQVQRKQYILTHKLVMAQFSAYRATTYPEDKIKQPIPCPSTGSKPPFQLGLVCGLIKRGCSHVLADDRVDEVLALYIQLLACDEEPKRLVAAYSVDILKRNGDKQAGFKWEQELALEPPEHTTSCSNIIETRPNLLNEEKQLLSEDGTLTLLIEITVYREQILVAEQILIISESRKSPQQVPSRMDQLVAACRTRLEADLDALQRSKSNIGSSSSNLSSLSIEDSDIRLESGGREFHANKMLLAARSPVLARMFANSGSNLTQASSSGLSVASLPLLFDRIHPEALNHLLEYIYSSKVATDLPKDQDSRDAVRELLLGAIKLELPELVALCEERLRLSLSVDSVGEALLLAESKRLAQLKMDAIEYIASHAKEVMATRDWAQLIASDQWPDLAKELFVALANKSK